MRTVTIRIGDSIPAGKLQVATEEGPVDKTTADLFNGKRVALFAAPGAFTPTCHATHMPSIVAAARKFAEKGVDAVYCMSVNDADRKSTRLNSSH